MKSRTKERAHSIFPASGSERWLNCPASVNLSKDMPSQDSVYSIEGTKAHECLEAFLKEFLGKGLVYSVKDKLLEMHPPEMVEHAWEAFKYIADRFDKCGDGTILHSEIKLYNSQIHPEMFGTTDAAIVEEYGWLEVIDFKYGAGIAVDVKDNTQLIQYALGLLEKYSNLDFRGVRLIIIQPRAEHKDGPIRIHEMRLSELYEWQKLFVNGVTKATAPSPEFKSGSHCYWCPAKIKCPEISKKALKEAQADFDVIPETKAEIKKVVETFSPKELGEILTGLEKVDIWAKAVRDYAEKQLIEGKRVPGYKMVWKRAQRQWHDIEKVEKAAKAKFGKAAFSKPELLSPAQMEKATKDKEWVSKFTTEVSAGFTMVPEGDKREGVDVKGIAKFMIGDL